MLLKMTTGQQQNKDFYDSGEVSAYLHVGYVTCSLLPSKKYQTEAKNQTNSPFVCLKPSWWLLLTTATQVNPQ